MKAPLFSETILNLHDGLILSRHALHPCKRQNQRPLARRFFQKPERAALQRRSVLYRKNARWFLPPRKGRASAPPYPELLPSRWWQDHRMYTGWDRSEDIPENA